MIVAGIDASTSKSGISIFKDGKYITHTLIDLHKDKDAFHRTLVMMSEICDYLSKYSIDKILVEETVLTSNADTLKKLAYVAGGIMLYAHEHDIEFKFILPSAWRKTVGLQQSKAKREVLKLESIQAVRQEYNIDVTDDESDAILIGRSAFDLPKINITSDDIDIVLLSQE